MKKLACALAALLLAATLTACGGGETAASGVASTPASSVAAG